MWIYAIVCTLHLQCPSTNGIVEIVGTGGEPLYQCFDGKIVCPSVTGPFDNATVIVADSVELEERYGGEQK